MWDALFDPAVTIDIRTKYSDIIYEFVKSGEKLLVLKTLSHPTDRRVKAKSGQGFDDFDKFCEHVSELRPLYGRPVYYKGCEVSEFTTLILVDEKIYPIERNEQTGIWDIIKKTKPTIEERVKEIKNSITNNTQNSIPIISSINADREENCHTDYVDYVDYVIPTINMLQCSKRDDSENFDLYDLIQCLQNGRTPCW